MNINEQELQLLRAQLPTVSVGASDAKTLPLLIISAVGGAGALYGYKKSRGSVGSAVAGGLGGAMLATLGLVGYAVYGFDKAHASSQAPGAIAPGTSPPSDSFTVNPNRSYKVSVAISYRGASSDLSQRQFSYLTNALQQAIGLDRGISVVGTRSIQDAFYQSGNQDEVLWSGTITTQGAPQQIYKGATWTAPGGARTGLVRVVQFDDVGPTT